MSAARFAWPAWARTALSLVASPPVVGALVMLYLASRAAKAPVVGDHDAALGAQAEEVAAIVAKHFSAQIGRITGALAAAAIAAGLVLGLAAGILVEIRDAMCARTLGRRSKLVRALGLTLLLELWFVLEAMARRPQLYADAWYAAGGLRRTAQVLATDVLGPGGVAFVGGLFFIAYGIGLPRTRGVVVDRLAALASRARRRFAMATTALAIAVPYAIFGGRGDAPVVAHASGPVATPASAPATALASAGTRPNILVLAADSLRADRLDARRMPNVSALVAARGVRFDKSYVSLPRTFPSWVTILTGRYPYKHGVRTMFPTWTERAHDFDALPERLARAGYRTSVVSDYAGDIFGRIDLGFQRVDTPTFDFGEMLRQRALERETPLLPFLDGALGRVAFPVLREFQTAADPDLLADDAIRAVRASGDAPFFLTVFFSTAHFPYAAPYPYYRKFTDRSYRGRFKYHKPVGLASEGDLDDDDVAQVRGLYDGAVSAIDSAMGRVLRELESRGLADRTIVVVTADHGETLFEHGRWHGHGDHLFGDEGTRVPFAVIAPGKRASVVPAVTRDVDFAATVYDLTGVAPPPDLDGRSLAPLLDGRPVAPALAYAETELWMGDTPGVPSELRMPVPPVTRLLELDGAHGSEIVLRDDVRGLTTMARHRMVRDERFKLVYMPTRERAVYRLYDTQADPDETVEVGARYPAELERLKHELWKWLLADKSLVRRGDYLFPATP